MEGTTNGKVTIQKGIPIPHPKGRIPKYPWDDLDVGDSFLVHAKTGSGNLKYANFKYAPKHFLSRKTTEGIRVWRDQ